MSLPPEVFQRLPVGRRIKYNREFTRIKTAGRRVTLGCLILNWLMANDTKPAKVGVVVSKRVGNAVQRNRAKRLMREAFRRHQTQLPASLQLVLVARPSIRGRSYAVVERDFTDALRQARVLV